MRRSLALAILLPFVACGGSGRSGTGPSSSTPTYPTITGTYSDAALLSKELYLDGNWAGGSRCEGYFTIDHQAQSTWSGRLETTGRGHGTGAYAGGNPCSHGLATVSGTVTTGGAIRFGVTASSTGVGEECRVVSAPDLSGTVEGRQLNATRNVQLECWLWAERGGSRRRVLVRVRMEERVAGRK